VCRCETFTSRHWVAPREARSAQPETFFGNWLYPQLPSAVRRFLESALPRRAEGSTTSRPRAERRTIVALGINPSETDQFRRSATPACTLEETPPKPSPRSALLFRHLQGLPLFILKAAMENRGERGGHAGYDELLARKKVTHWVNPIINSGDWPFTSRPAAIAASAAVYHFRF
jgi:hypothetical protein